MAMDSEFRKKLQVFLVVAIVLAGGRAAYIVYERHDAMKEDTKPKQERTRMRTTTLRQRNCMPTI